MDRLNIRTPSDQEEEGADEEGEFEVLEVFVFKQNKIQVLEGNGIGGTFAMGRRRRGGARINNSAASMLNGAKQTAKQFLQKLGPNFM